jgi:hypothetical protein
LLGFIPCGIKLAETDSKNLLKYSEKPIGIKTITPVK